MAKKQPKVQMRVECSIPQAGYIHDLMQWLGPRGIKDGKIVWYPWASSSSEFASMMKRLQAEHNIELSWTMK